MDGSVQALMRYLDGSVSPFHCVKESAALLEREGFQALEPGAPWQLEPGGAYYVSIYDSSLLAFRAGDLRRGIRLAGAHTDWPCMRVRPDPETVSGGCCRLSVEMYGGALMSTWFDRPLSLAGMVLRRGEDALHPVRELVSFDRPVLTLPSLAIHMNRNANSGVELNARKDMPPLCRIAAEGWEKDGYLTKRLAEQLGVSSEEILSFDLVVFNPQPASLVGFEQDMLLSPRLDNLTSAFACLWGLASSGGDCFRAAVLYDNEEIGSRTKQGADSSILPALLEKACAALGYGRGEFLDGLVNGLLLSCDVAHAQHPNHTEKADDISRSLMGRGVSLKLNASQKYATDAVGWAIVEELCRRHAIPHQRYANRPDMAGGGTIGSIAAALMGIRAVDVGVPILAMHASAELMGAADQDSLNRLVRAVLED